MGTLTSALLTLMLSWVRGLVAIFWRLADDGGEKLLDLFSRAWLPLSLAMIAVGLFLDRVVWLLHYGTNRFSSKRGKKGTGARQEETPRDAEPEKAWLPEPPFEAAAETPADENEESAETIPDEELGVYPGMRYNPAASGNTRRIRRALAPQETKNYARSVEAREEYERQMEIYRREQTQYERDLAEYERQKAAYDAALQAEAEEENAEGGTDGSGTESASRRRRRSGA